MDSSAQPSVAQLAGRFREQAAVAREVSLEVLTSSSGRGLEEEEAPAGPEEKEGKQSLGNYQIRKRSQRGSL